MDRVDATQGDRQALWNAVSRKPALRIEVDRDSLARVLDSFEDALSRLSGLECSLAEYKANRLGGFSPEELEDTIMAYGVASYRTNLSAVGDRLDTLAHEFRAELKRRRGNTP